MNSKNQSLFAFIKKENVRKIKNLYTKYFEKVKMKVFTQMFLVNLNYDSDKYMMYTVHVIMKINESFRNN